MKNYRKIEETLIAFRNGELGLKEAMFVIEGFTTQSYEQRVKDERVEGGGSNKESQFKQ